MKKRSTLRTSLLAALVFMIGVVYPALAADKEQLVKAAFLFNFTKFASWPSPIAIASQTEINICILGPNTLDDAKAVIEKGSTSALKINTKMLSAPPTAPGQCHIVYITQSSGMESAIAQSHLQYALTVGDAEGFTDMGGMIGFIKESNKIRLHINKCSVEAAGLKLDAQLLEIARKVNGGC